uniref:Reverse transcriptase domain-containing protein n=2 Tax=Photinus pyralis TaxID=7054 RepID=A0A1Y1M452_PHOPY
MERMVNNRLVSMLEKDGRISKYQAGFRKGHSTVDQLLYLDYIVKGAFTNTEHATAVFFDIKKAYDTVWKYGVLETLHRWEFRGHLPIFIENFLKDRRIQVRMGEHLSQIVTQENGIPQGSVLSVTLFAIAINNIADAISIDTKALLYVDDLCIVRTGHNVNSMYEALQMDINILSEEATKRGFAFSTNKTKAMHFCRLRKTHQLPPLYLQGDKLPTTENLKFLGLILDTKLTWKHHIEAISSKCKLTLNRIRVLSGHTWGADKETLTKVVNAFIRSKLEYGSVVYTSAARSQLKSIEGVWNKAMLLITGAYRTSPIDSLNVENNSLPIYLRFKQQHLRYAVKLLAQPSHFLFEVIKNPILHPRYEWQQTRTIPAIVKLNKEIRDYGKLDGNLWEEETPEFDRKKVTDFLLKEINKDFVVKWQEVWSTKETHLRVIHPQLEGKRCTKWQIKRKDQIAITRLRIGHTRLTHSHLLLGKRNKKCAQCGETLTVQHIMNDCIKLDTYRHKYNISLGVLNNPVKYTDVIKYLKEINIYTEI